MVFALYGNASQPVPTQQALEHSAKRVDRVDAGLGAQLQDEDRSIGLAAHSSPRGWRRHSRRRAE
jgi:hypothetical protein